MPTKRFALSTRLQNKGLKACTPIRHVLSETGGYHGMKQVKYPVIHTHCQCLSLFGVGLVFKWVQPWLLIYCSGHRSGPGSLSSTREAPVQRSMRAFCPHRTQNPALQLLAQCPLHTVSMQHAAIHSYLRDPNKRIKWLLSLAGRSQSPPEPSKHLTISYIVNTLKHLLHTHSLITKEHLCFCGGVWIFKNFTLVAFYSQFPPIPSYY